MSIKGGHGHFITIVSLKQKQIKYDDMLIKGAHVPGGVYHNIDIHNKQIHWYYTEISQ